LLAPVPAVSSAELEGWLLGADTASGAEDGEPALVGWQTALSPFALAHVAQQVWLLVCSLTLLAVGLVLFLTPLPRWLFWTFVALLGVGVSLLGLLAPAVLPALLYGCEPGAVVLLGVVSVQWMLHQRYRRQVIFMPGFSRVKSGSSLVRGGSSNRKREVAREPSTIDQPPERGSSSTGSELRG
jgi:hypothetical protein